MASGLYNRFRANLMNKVVDMEADTIKVALYDNNHSFSPTDTDFTTDNEVSGSGYTSGGISLTTKIVTEAAPAKWDADDASWPAATFTAYHAVIYDSTAGNDLIASIDLGGAKAVAAGTLTIIWDANGIVLL